MNYIKRAFVSIVRRPGKSLILLILIFILGNVIAGAVSVQQAVKQTEASIRKGIGATSRIDLDYSKIAGLDGQEQKKVKPLPAEVIEKLGKLPSVKYYDYNATGYLYSNSETLKPYQSDSGNVHATVGGGMPFSTKGVQYNEMLPFKEGNGKLLGGRTFTKEEVSGGAKVTLISKQLAEANNLQIGDKISLKNHVYDYSKMPADGSSPTPIASQDIELEVIGIYEPKQQTKKDDKTGMVSFQNDEAINTIYVPNKVVAEMNDFANAEMSKIGEQTSDAFYQPVYVLKDASDLEVFRKEAEALIDDNYKVNDGNSDLSKVAGPLSTIKWIAGIVLYAAIGATLLILSLLITLFLRDRKHEMGIYLSLGEGRVKVAAQIVLETFTIALTAITLSLFSGNLVAQKVSQTMLNNQLIAKQKEDSSGQMIISESSGYESGLSEEDVIDSYQVSLDKEVIIAFYAAGLGSVFVSTLVPITYIVRLKPKKIML